MTRTFLLALTLSALAGCADDTTLHHRTPPQDPPDYHGVPTDTRPPQIIDAPDAAAQ
ncbi:hypothetical protein [Paraburkholderia solisilvae]|uniref:Lipoprotein n=1 Tax=Paraburkholderia solisilvae TaxID=624376 RepID=A0A6J5D8B9_9BURK|nr:hypothetical protein [Paraburkholderia solisilvae]CAB3748976.1 hypothetical protein LMG29739_00648 [Paraburkholderia solisilvae]